MIGWLAARRTLGARGHSSRPSDDQANGDQSRDNECVRGHL
jgi:hypothetical protein